MVKRGIQQAAQAEAGGRATAAPAFLRVRKRDGREVPYDQRKIAEAVARALAAVGEADDGFAREVAAVVELELRRRAQTAAAIQQTSAAPREDFAPHIEEIQDLVEQALIGLGRAAAAKAFILYRERRAQVRAALEVESGPRAQAGPGPRVLEARRSAPWSKARIAAALMEEAGLPRAVAEEVAARVEERVFSSGLTRISTGLIRELVDHELVARGLTRALARQEALKLPRHDLRRMLAGELLEPKQEAPRGHADAPVDLERSVAGALLARYALEDLLPQRVLEGLLGGDLFVEELERLHQPLWIAVRPELLGVREASVESAFALLGELGELARSVAQGIVLDEADALLAALVRGTRAQSPLGLSAWMRALVALARASDRRIDLVAPRERSAQLGARLCEELLRLQDERGAPRVFVDGADLDAWLAAEPALSAAVERLLASGALVPSFSSVEAHWLGADLSRLAPERGVLALSGAVFLNLPRFARRAGPWREDALCEELVAQVQVALEAFRALREVERSFAAARPRPALRLRAGYALGVVGLREGLQVLGGGEVDPEQGARLLGLLSDALVRCARPGDPIAWLTSGCGGLARRASRRLARLDAEEARNSGLRQGTLFAEDSRELGAYTDGWRLSPLSGWRPGEAEAAVCAAQPAGVFDARSLSAACGASEDLAALNAWRRFRAARERAAGRGRGLLLPLAAPGSNPRSPRVLLQDSVLGTLPKDES